MLTINQLSKKLEYRPVLINVSFHVPHGTFFTLLGDSGAGKTTMLRLIAGLEFPDEGSVIIDGHDLTAMPAVKRSIPLIFQQPLLFPHLTVYQNIAFGLEVKRWTKKRIDAKVSSLLEQLQIETLSGRMPATLSGGQQQRTAIARALAADRPLLLMDEPFTGLDPGLRHEMGQLVKNLQQQLNLTVIFVTHDVTEAMQHSDQILLLKDGRVLQSGTPSELFEKPASIETAYFMGSGNIVHGHVLEGIFSCPLGSFNIGSFPDGDAWGLIPGHKIKVTDAPSGTTVSEVRYQGKTTRVLLHVNGIPLWAETFSNRFYKGQTVCLELPKNIHLISKT